MSQFRLLRKFAVFYFGVFTVYLTVTVLFCAVSRADTWEEYLGYHVLKNDKGEVLKAWNKTQWSNLEQQMNAVGSDSAYATNAEWYSAVEGAGETKYKGAAEMVEKVRTEGLRADTTDVEGIENMGVGGDVLPGDVGAEALGAPEIAAGAGVVALGVALGYGIDELFGVKLENPFETEEEAHFAEETYEERVVYKEGGIHQIVNTVPESETYISLPPAYYLECGKVGFGAFAKKELKFHIPERTVETIEVECSGHAKMENTVVKVLVYGHAFGETHEPVEPLVWLTFGYSNPRCDASIWLVETLLPPCVKPLELPGPGEITKEIEEHNREHELPSVPVEPNPKKRQPDIIPVPPSKIEKGLEKEHFRKKVEELEPKEEGIELPIPEKGEEGKPYREHLEELGFENPTEKAVPENFINPEVGPKDIVKINPEPGKKYEPKTHVEVEVNPEDAPAPEEGGSVTGPNEPGFDVPNFGVLCHGFPFGVPCWLAETIEKMSVTGTAPEWTVVPEIEEDGHTIHSGKFNFSVLEPLMEILRPVMVGFSVIGIVLLFYRFAKGASPESGTGGAGSSATESEDEGV